MTLVDNLSDNKETTRSVGRPRKFSSPEDLESKIDAYFASCTEETTDEQGKTKIRYKRPYTITGLALALDTTRKTLLNYRKEYEAEYLPSLKKALEICQNFAEENLYTGKQVAGTIFVLKNNYGWKDVQEINVKAIEELSDEELERKIGQLQQVAGLEDGSGSVVDVELIPE